MKCHDLGPNPTARFLDHDQLRSRTLPRRVCDELRRRARSLHPVEQEQCNEEVARAFVNVILMAATYQSHLNLRSLYTVRCEVRTYPTITVRADFVIHQGSHMTLTNVICVVECKRARTGGTKRKDAAQLAGYISDSLPAVILTILTDGHDWRLTVRDQRHLRAAPPVGWERSKKILWANANEQVITDSIHCFCEGISEVEKRRGGTCVAVQIALDSARTYKCKNGTPRFLVNQITP